MNANRIDPMYVQQSAPRMSIDTCAHVWHEDSDDEGRTFKRCVRKGGCGHQSFVGTTATRW